MFTDDYTNAFKAFNQLSNNYDSKLSTIGEDKSVYSLILSTAESI